MTCALVTLPPLAVLRGKNAFCCHLSEGPPTCGNEYPSLWLMWWPRRIQISMVLIELFLALPAIHKTLRR